MDGSPQAKKILRLYGKAEYKARLEYIEDFLPEEEKARKRVRSPRFGKRSVLAAAVAAVILFLLVSPTTVNEIRLLGFHLLGHPGYTPVTLGGEPEEEIYFYEPTYIPEGYVLIDEDQVIDERFERTYKNAEGLYLHIDQCDPSAEKANIDNEDMTRANRVIDGIDVLICQYNDENRGEQYLLNKEGTLIIISGVMDAEEFEKIICGLE